MGSYNVRTTYLCCITIVVSDDTSVKASHDLTQDIENLLFKQFNVTHVDVHIKPIGMH